MKRRFRELIPAPTRRAAVLGLSSAAMVALWPPAGFAAFVALVLLGLFDFVATRRRGLPDFTLSLIHI